MHFFISLQEDAVTPLWVLSGKGRWRHVNAASNVNNVCFVVYYILSGIWACCIKGIYKTIYLKNAAQSLPTQLVDITGGARVFLGGSKSTNLGQITNWRIDKDHFRGDNYHYRPQWGHSFGWKSPLRWDKQRWKSSSWSHLYQWIGRHPNYLISLSMGMFSYFPHFMLRKMIAN